MGKMKALAHTHADMISERVLGLVDANTPLKEVRRLIASRSMRACMNDALAHAIEREIEDICFDIIDFSKNEGLVLMFNARTMQHLIKGRMYAIIEDLINARCMYVSFDERGHQEQLAF